MNLSRIHRRLAVAAAGLALSACSFAAAAGSSHATPAHQAGVGPAANWLCTTIGQLHMGLCLQSPVQ